MHTPNLDRLAARGTRLSRIYSTTPVCVPQRVTWTTGRYPMNTGCYGNAHPISGPDVPSFVRNLQESVVATALIGKFHNHANYDFADFIAHEGDLHRLGYDYVCETSGKINAGHHRIRCRFTEFLEGMGLFAAYREWIEKELSQYSRVMPSGAWPWNEEHSQDGFIAGKAVEYVRPISVERPFYLHLGFVGPHPQFDAHERYRTHYAEVSPPIPLGPDPTRRVVEWWRAYCACITEVDSGIGRVIEALEERDLLDDTVILYTSDHGEYAGDHGRWGKGDFHEPGVHVPFIASGPGIAAGHTSDVLAELIDAGRTVVDLMGVEPHHLDQGRSLKPVLSGRKQSHREDYFAEMGPHKMLFDGRYKLLFGSIRTTIPDDCPDELMASGAPVCLFDLVEDADETRNLAGDPSHHDTLRMMKEKLLQRIIANLQSRPSGIEGKPFTRSKPREESVGLRLAVLSERAGFFGCIRGSRPIPPPTSS